MIYTAKCTCECDARFFSKHGRTKEFWSAVVPNVLLICAFGEQGLTNATTSNQLNPRLSALTTNQNQATLLPAKLKTEMIMAT